MKFAELRNKLREFSFQGFFPLKDKFVVIEHFPNICISGRVFFYHLEATKNKQMSGKWHRSPSELKIHLFYFLKSYPREWMVGLELVDKEIFLCRQLYWFFPI